MSKLIRGLLAACLLLLALPAAPVPALTLDQCVKLALEKNPGLARQKMEQDLAGSDLGEQKARAYGRIDFVSSYNHYNLPRTLAPMTPGTIIRDPLAVPTTEDLFTVGVVYQVELFTGFSQTRSLEIAGLQKKMSRIAFRLGREQLVYDVKTLYVNILSQQAQARAQASYLQALQRLHRDIAYQLKLGKKSRLDLLKASADLEKAKARLKQLESNLEALKASLAALLDRESIPALEDIPTRPRPLARRDLYTSLPRLQRIQKARLETEKSKLQVDKAGSDLYPRIVLTAAYGQNFGPNDSSHYHSWEWENQEVWQAGLNLKWNILDFGIHKARVQKARIKERQSRYQKRATELELRKALQEAATRIDSAVSDYQSARSEVALTREAEAIEQVRFQRGAADINDLLYAKARHQLALSRFISAGYRYLSSRYYLDYLLESGENK